MDCGDSFCGIHNLKNYSTVKDEGNLLFNTKVRNSSISLNESVMTPETYAPASHGTENYGDPASESSVQYFVADSVDRESRRMSRRASRLTGSNASEGFLTSQVKPPQGVMKMHKSKSPEERHREEFLKRELGKRSLKLNRSNSVPVFGEFKIPSPESQEIWRKPKTRGAELKLGNGKERKKASTLESSVFQPNERPTLYSVGGPSTTSVGSTFTPTFLSFGSPVSVPTHHQQQMDHQRTTNYGASNNSPSLKNMIPDTGYVTSNYATTTPAVSFLPFPELKTQNFYRMGYHGGCLTYPPHYRFLHPTPTFVSSISIPGLATRDSTPIPGLSTFSQNTPLFSPALGHSDGVKKMVTIKTPPPIVGRSRMTSQKTRNGVGTGGGSQKRYSDYGYPWTDYGYRGPIMDTLL